MCTAPAGGAGTGCTPHRRECRFRRAGSVQRRTGPRGARTGAACAAAELPEVQVRLGYPAPSFGPPVREGGRRADVGHAAGAGQLIDVGGDPLQDRSHPGEVNAIWRQGIASRRELSNWSTPRIPKPRPGPPPLGTVTSHPYTLPETSGPLAALFVVIFHGWPNRLLSSVCPARLASCRPMATAIGRAAQFSSGTSYQVRSARVSSLPRDHRSPRPRSPWSHDLLQPRKSG